MLAFTVQNINPVSGQHRSGASGAITTPSKDRRIQSAFELVNAADLVGVGHPESFKMVEKLSERAWLIAERQRVEAKMPPDQRAFVMPLRYGSIERIRLASVLREPNTERKTRDAILLFTPWELGKLPVSQVGPKEEESLLVLRAIPGESLAKEYDVDSSLTYHQFIDNYEVVHWKRPELPHRAPEPINPIYSRVLKFCDAIRVETVGERLFRLEQLRLSSDPILAEDARREIERQRRPR
jgi:hypothetical protein